MEFYSSDILNVSSTGVNQSPTINCASPSAPSLQLPLGHFHHSIGQSICEAESIGRSGSDSTAIASVIFQSSDSFRDRSRSSECLLTGSGSGPLLEAENQSDRNAAPVAQCLLGEPFHTHQPQYQLASVGQHPQLPQTACKHGIHSSPNLHHKLEFQFDKIHSCPVTSDSIPPSTPLNLDLSNHDISNSILGVSKHPAPCAATLPVTANDNLIGLSACYPDGGDLSALAFQSSVVDQALMGFEPGFQFQEHHHSDHELDDDRSNCRSKEFSPFSSHQQQIGQEHQIQIDSHQQSGWHSFASNSSILEDEQRPLTPNEMATIRSSPPHLAHPSNLYFNSSPLYSTYTESGSLPPLAIDLSQSPTMIRTGSNASEFSTGSSVNSNGVNPIHVNPLSQPLTPQDDLFAPLTDSFHQPWWGNQQDSPSVESLVNNVTASMSASLQNATDHEVGVRMPSIFSQHLKVSSGSAGDSNNSVHSVSPYQLPPQSKAPRSPSFHLPNKTRRSSHRTNLPNHHRSNHSKISSRPFLVDPDYSRLPTKRSRGRRPPISPDLGLPIPDGHLSIGLQSVPGGQAFDPNLNPNAETVKYCELTKTGKPKKIFICQVKGCGKCFKRSEHLKRHVRSIHTNDKPYNCPWMACMKSFSRHDNLNQHLRVHRVEEGGDVLNGLHIGSDGVLRSDFDESPVDPVIRGLRDVEVVDRFIIDE